MKSIFIFSLTIFSLLFANEANSSVKNNQWALNSRNELGDINQDGVINILDIVILARIILDTLNCDKYHLPSQSCAGSI